MINFFGKGVIHRLRCFIIASLRGCGWEHTYVTTTYLIHIGMYAATDFIIIEPQWLERICNHENMFEQG